MRLPLHELAIWAALMGGLVTLAALALSEWLTEAGGLGALRNLFFVLLTGAAVVVIVDLPQNLYPELNGPVLRMLKVSLGPLAASVTLYYLGQWMGGAREDPLMGRITTVSAALLMAMALGLAVAALVVPAERFRSLVWVTAVVNTLAVLPGLAACLRAAWLGDRLARWMAVAVAVLGAMTVALYHHGLSVPGPGLGMTLLAAVLTLTYFIMASTLVSLRNRELRHLKRLSRIEPGTDPATQLPTGSHVLRKVEDTFWSAGRRQAQCAVICLYIGNLYDAVSDEDNGTEYQVMVAMAARIRRAAGFRCAVGIYHPRCFAVVITLEGDQSAFAATLTRLRAYVAEPIDLVRAEQPPQRFMPRVGLGVVVANAATAVPYDVLEEAEQQARKATPQDVPDTGY